MSRYRSIRVTTTGEGAMSDDEARAMFGLPPRVEDGEAEEAARELLGGVGLSAVPSGDGSEDGDIPGFTTTEGPADAEVNEVEEGVSAAE